MDIEKIFESCSNEQDIYKKLIELGKTLDTIPSEYMQEENRVQGCQSTSYLYSKLKDGSLHFYGSSDALISSGLMKVMLIAYSGKSPEFILKAPPTFLEKMGILSSISLTRVNGLKSLHLLMKQQALQSLIKT